jgi:hypothetical protein
VSLSWRIFRRTIPGRRAKVAPVAAGTVRPPAP